MGAHHSSNTEIQRTPHISPLAIQTYLTLPAVRVVGPKPLARILGVGVGDALLERLLVVAHAARLDDALQVGLERHAARVGHSQQKISFRLLSRQFARLCLPGFLFFAFEA